MVQTISYVLADVAELDISDIYDYTVTTHGVTQASTYLSGLENTLQTLITNPTLGKHRPEIRDGLRSFLYEEHTIFYRVIRDHIRIVRILHARRDMPKYL